MQLNTPRQEERPGGGVIELPPVVALDGLNGEAELCGHPDKKVEEGGEGLRLSTQRKSPRVAKEKSKSSARNHRPPPDSIYSQKG